MTRLVTAVAVSYAIGCGSAPTASPRADLSPASPVTNTPSPASADLLQSWKDGATKRAIVDFVGRVTRMGGPDFVPVAERIVTFDNDGTLWSEKPVPFQLLFAFDRVRALAPQHTD